MSDLPLDPEDFALRARVKLLGKLLGQVIAEHARPGVFEVVEELRTGFIALRGGDVEHAEPLDTMIRALDAETMMQVVRAFTIYFQLVNVADELYQHRARRRQVAQGGRLWVGSFDDSLASAVDASAIRRIKLRRRCSISASVMARVLGGWRPLRAIDEPRTDYARHPQRCLTRLPFI